eukprot:GILI01011246.1.p1 GENE.GILI01011246.1~~GILI01011246.1.p1  ORF type:complete len:941 (-),score=217.46 GILI01011246.1:82-2613(-)
MSLSLAKAGGSLALNSTFGNPSFNNTLTEPFAAVLKGHSDVPLVTDRMHWPTKEATHADSQQGAQMDRSKPLHARSLVPKIAPSEVSTTEGTMSKRLSTVSQLPALGRSLQTGDYPAQTGNAILQVHIATATGQTHVARFEIPRKLDAIHVPPSSPLISSLIAAMPKASSAHAQQRGSMISSPASIFSVAALQAQQAQLQQQMQAFYSKDLGGIIMQGSKNALGGRLDPSTSYITFYAYTMAQIKAWQHSASSNIMGTNLPSPAMDSDSPRALLSVFSSSAHTARAGAVKVPAITSILPGLPNGAENDIALRPDPEDPTTSFLVFFRLYYVRNGQRFPISTDKELEAFLAPSRGPVYTCNCAEITEATAEYLSAMMRRGEISPSDGQALLSGRPSRPATGALDNTAVPLALREKGAKAGGTLENMISTGLLSPAKARHWSTLNSTGVSSAGDLSSITVLGRNGVPIDEFGIPIGRGEKRVNALSEASAASSPSVASPGTKRKPFFNARRANTTVASGTASPIDATQQSISGAQGDTNANANTEGQNDAVLGGNGATDGDGDGLAPQDPFALRSPLFSGAVSNNLFLHSAIIDVPSETRLRRVYQQLYLMANPLPRDLLDALRYDRSNKIARDKGEAAGSRYSAEEDDFFAAGSDGDEANVNLYTTGLRSESLQVPASMPQPAKEAKDKDMAKDGDEEEDPREAELRRLEDARRKRVTAAHVLRYLFKHHDSMGDPMRFWRLLEGVLHTHGITNGATAQELMGAPSTPAPTTDGGDGVKGGAEHGDKRKSAVSKSSVDGKTAAVLEHYVTRERRGGIDALRPVKLHTQITFPNFVLIVLKLVQE